MNQITVYFVRHGHVHNPKAILYGRLPRFPLSETGKNEAKLSGEKLKGSGIKHLYSSPMLRAKQTSLIIGKLLGIKPKYSKHLIELDLIFQGMPASEYKMKIQPYLFEDKYIKKGQESIEEVHKRMNIFFQKLLRKHKGETVMVVSHGDPISIFVAKTMGLEFTWEYKKANYLRTGQFYKLEYKDGMYKWTK